MAESEPTAPQSLQQQVETFLIPSEGHSEIDANGNRVLKPGHEEMEIDNKVTALSTEVYRRTRDKDDEVQTRQYIEHAIRGLRYAYPAHAGILNKQASRDPLLISVVESVFQDSLEESNQKLNEFLNPQE